MLEYIGRRPFAVLGAFIGIALCAFFVLRTENTRTTAGDVQNKIVRIEASSPCTALTTRECAQKLFGSLTREDRRKLVTPAVRREVKQEIERRQKVRLRERARKSVPGADGVDEAPVLPPASRSPSPSRGSGGGSSSPSGGSSQSPSGSTDEPAGGSTTNPVITTPDVDLPPIGPIDPPPIKLPDVPCVKTPVTTC